MRKRLVAAALCAALLLALSLGRPEVRDGENYDLYFRVTDLETAPGADALCPERLFLEDAEVPDTLALAERLMTELLEGPEDPDLTGAIPADTELLSLELNGSTATVDLSGRYRVLSGVALSLADYAITLTLTQLPEISAVNITVRGQQLAYRDRQTFTAGDVLFSSNEDVIDDVAVTLYLLDESGGRLLTAEVLSNTYSYEAGGFGQTVSTDLSDHLELAVYDLATGRMTYQGMLHTGTEAAWDPGAAHLPRTYFVFDDALQGEGAV